MTSPETIKERIADFMEETSNFEERERSVEGYFEPKLLE